MKYYIVDDDKNIVRILTSIIEENGEAEVVGSSYEGETAFHEILLSKPDIVLADLLMPVMDGTTLVKRLKPLMPNLCFIMISQVLDHDLRAEAYEAGIEFFIGKPINKIEVRNVVLKVAERIEMEQTLNHIKRLFKNETQTIQKEEQDILKIKHILGMLGMLGEKGTNDILTICIYLLANNKSVSECEDNEIQSLIGDSPQMVKQRIRRAIKGGLTNIASLGIEDYSNEFFQTYAGVLFDFASVRSEMDALSRNTSTGGKISVNKFFEGLLLMCSKDE
ncbi:MAG: DNA-binding domain-containing protein [Anaerovorax sp.]|nr:DNA-binding domain-containing protein [Anaerovorax sp.]